MEDPVPIQRDAPGADDNHDENDDDQISDERQRQIEAAEEAMERLMLAQEAAAEEDGDNHGDGGDDDDDGVVVDDDDNDANNNNGIFDDDGNIIENNVGNEDGRFGAMDGDGGAAAVNGPAAGPDVFNYQKPKRLSYIQMSFMAAVGLVYYAYRSRQQWYLAIVFLTSSKWAYIVMGNTLVATLMASFSLFTSMFLDGLRLMEVEGIAEFFRWNVTETCLALTIFRSEIDVRTIILFLVFVLIKCLHWVAEQRMSHLRMTEEMVVVRPSSSWPSLRWTHIKLLGLLLALQFVDIIVVVECSKDILERGPNVSILFAFEGAIMLTSAVSCVLLWNLHLVDGILNFLHETTDRTNPAHRWVHWWHEYKATLVFAVEVQAQVVKFTSYLTFFAIVMTYYGLPINLIREVYISFQQLKQRLVAFGKYRSLMAGMNRFASPTEEQLEEERTCIICRDEMTTDTAKRLPGCGHIFHKSCLREWLTQQQTCPTCRSDISAMEARQRQANLMNAAAQGREAEQQQQQQQQQQQEEVGEPGDADANETTPPRGDEEETHVGGPIADENDVESNNLNPVNSNDNSSGAKSPERPRLQDVSEAVENAASGLDQKFSGTDTSTQGQPDKRVQITSPARGVTISSKNDSPAFPAFYRVVQAAGTMVHDDNDSFVIRTVPCGVILIGQELSRRNCNGEKMMMLRMPDGWICEDDVERIVSIEFTT